jgi:hypothetical protein
MWKQVPASFSQMAQLGLGQPKAIEEIIEFPKRFSSFQQVQKTHFAPIALGLD